MGKEYKDYGEDAGDTLDKKLVSELVARVLNMAVYAHMEHFLTSSYSDHKALNHLYDRLPDVIDSYTEHVQAIYGRCAKFPVLTPVIRPMRTMLPDLVSWIDDNEDYLTGGDTTIENDLAEIRAVLLRAIYRLKNLS